MTNWIEEFAIKRRANRSNVYLMETLDPQRISEFQELLKKPRNGHGGTASATETAKDLPIKAVIGYDVHGVVFDIQRGTLYDLWVGEDISDQPSKMQADGTLNLVSFPNPVLQWIDRELRSESRIPPKGKEPPLYVIVKNIVEPQHAQMMVDALVSWSQDDDIYSARSTIIPFLSDKNLFGDTVRRLCYAISIFPSTPEERRAVMTSLVDKLHSSGKLAEAAASQLSKDINEELVKASQGLTLHDTTSATLESILQTRRIQLPIFTGYKTKILQEFGFSYVVPTRGFESVGGYGALKDYIQSHIILPMRQPARAIKYGKTSPRGLILYGIPGGGKTWFSKALAKEAGLPMLQMDASTFLRGIVGESEREVRRVVNLIEGLAPVITFVDEIDHLFLKREGEVVTDSGVRRNVLDQLLQWLGSEDRRSFIIGATNRLQDIDPALKRKGRIDEKLLILPPDKTARREILQIHSKMRNMPLSLTEENIAEIVNRTFLWTGADIEALVDEAATAATIEDTGNVTMKHFETSFECVTVNAEERKRSVKDTIEVISREEVVNRGFINKMKQDFLASEGSGDGPDARVKSIEGL